MNNYNSGYRAEFFARLLFRLKGYRILAINYVCGRGTHAGEIDFIATRRNVLVFVEVKKRTSLEQAAHAISDIQQQRIRLGAEVFLKKHPQYRNYNIRFDAVLIKFPYSIRHIKNAW